MSGAAPAGVLLVGNFLSPVVGSRNVIEDVAERLASTGVPLVCVSGRRQTWARALELATAPILHRASYRVAIVDLFSGRAFYWGAAASALLRLLGCPHALVLHGGGLPAFARRHPWSVRQCLQGATAVVSPSGYLISQLTPYRQDIGLLPNPLDVTRFRYRARRRLSPRLVWVRSFHEMYNPGMGPRVVAGLVRDFPDVRLTMVGPDKGDGSLDRTRALAAELGVADRITFTGGVNPRDVPEWLDSADVFLNTTRIDNTPVSVMEAMASGLCIVSTNVDGVPFLVRDGEDALLVPDDDPGAMTAAVSRLLQDEALSFAMSTAARRKAETWDWTVILPQWTRLLRSLDGQRHGQGRVAETDAR